MESSAAKALADSEVSSGVSSWSTSIRISRRVLCVDMRERLRLAHATLRDLTEPSAKRNLNGTTHQRCICDPEIGFRRAHVHAGLHLVIIHGNPGRHGGHLQQAAREPPDLLAVVQRNSRLPRRNPSKGYVLRTSCFPRPDCPLGLWPTALPLSSILLEEVAAIDVVARNLYLEIVVDVGQELDVAFASPRTS